MNKPEEGQSTTSEHVIYERCACHEIVETAQKYLGISPVARKHLANARVEVLKAVREILNERIEHLSNQGQKGTRVAVE